MGRGLCGRWGRRGCGNTEDLTALLGAFSLLASVSCSVFSHPCLPEGCHPPDKTCVLLVFCVGKLQTNPIAAENKAGDYSLFFFFLLFLSHYWPNVPAKKKRIGCCVTGETIFLVGYKTLCLPSEGLLALMLILPRFYCAVCKVKHVIIPSVVSAEIFHFRNKCAVFWGAAKPLPCAAPAAYLDSSAGWLGAFWWKVPFNYRRCYVPRACYMKAKYRQPVINLSWCATVYTPSPKPDRCKKTPSLHLGSSQVISGLSLENCSERIYPLRQPLRKEHL